MDVDDGQLMVNVPSNVRSTARNTAALDDPSSCDSMAATSISEPSGETVSPIQLALLDVIEAGSAALLDGEREARITTNTVNVNDGLVNNVAMNGSTHFM